MSSSALFEIPTSGYPGYDLEEIMFDMDDPDFENIPKQTTLTAKNQIHGERNYFNFIQRLLGIGR